VQWVRVTWTKASRGAPGATARNAVPRAVALPSSPPNPGTALVAHYVDAAEADRFAPVQRVEEHPGPVRLRRLRISAGPTGPSVQLDQELSGEPRRPHRPGPVLLTPDEWLCWRINWRFAWHDGWTYQADTIHLRRVEQWRPDLFLDGVPTRTIDESARLF
jgi:hypothetical protein